MSPPNPTERVLCVLPFAEPHDVLAQFRARFPSMEITFVSAGTTQGASWGDGAPSDDIYEDKTILVTISALPSSRSVAPKLKLVHFCCAGTNHVENHPIFKDASITLTTSSGMHGPPIAEWAWMTALVHSHQYNSLYERQKQQIWGRHDDFYKVRDMVGQRVGILGYGSIGRQVARLAKAMGTEVYAFTATPKDSPHSRRDNGYIVPGTGDPDGDLPDKWFSGLDTPSLHDFLGQDLDLLFLCLPLSNQTKHLLSHKEFDILSRKTAFLSNASRGAVIDQDALITALATSKLRGAALDVTDPEPLPLDHPLWRAPNVTITPHLSGLISNYQERAMEILALNLERKAQGSVVLNIINRGSS